MGWSNARTRSLLRGLRRPHILRTDAAIVALRQRYGVDDDRAALLRAVDAALANDPALREIVYRCDVRGENRAAVAESLYFSERQFHRYRSLAIETIAAEIERATAPDDPSCETGLIDAIGALDPARARDLLDRGGGESPERRRRALALRVESGDVPSEDEVRAFEQPLRAEAEAMRALAVELSGAYDEAEALRLRLAAALPPAETPSLRRAAFDLAGLRRLQGRRRGNIDEFVAGVEQARACAGDDASLRTRATIGWAHIGVHRAIEDWQERLNVAKRLARTAADVRVLRYATMVEGYLAYVHGDPESALRAANIAALAGANPAIALQAEALAARASLALGRRWSRPAWTRTSLPRVWFQAELDAFAARHALAAGDDGEARRLALDVLAHPSAPHAPSVVAYAQGVLARLDATSIADVPIPDDLLVDVDLNGVPAPA